MSLLVDDTVIPVSPDLAAKLGIHESIFLQQLHWLGRQVNRKDIHAYGGQVWVRHTYAHWLKQFPWLSDSALKRLIRRLKTAKLIVVESLDNAVLKLAASPVRWYRINYVALEEISNSILNNRKHEQARAARKNTAALVAAHGIGQTGHTAPLGVAGMGHLDPGVADQNDLMTYKRGIKISSSKTAKAVDFDFNESLVWIIRALSSSYELNETDKYFVEGKLREFVRRYGMKSEGDALSYIEQGLNQRLQIDFRSAKIGQAKNNRADAVTGQINAQAEQINHVTGKTQPVDHFCREWAKEAKDASCSG